MRCTRVWYLGVWGLLISAGSGVSLHAGQIEFLVAELPGTFDPHGDSFVIRIGESKTDLIAHARALVDWVEGGGAPALTPEGTIVVSKIAAGSNGINRNPLAPGEPLWSWHPVGQPGFASFTIEIFDGWPGYVEQDVPGWIANTNGHIGFWGYTVVAEIGRVVPEPSTLAMLVIAAAVVGAWIGKRYISK